MTQTRLRRCTLLYSVLLLLVNAIVLLYVREAGEKRVQYEFNKEMVTRLNFITVMAEWVTRELLTKEDYLNDISMFSPFEVSLTPLQRGEKHPPQTIWLSSGYPMRAYRYSSTLHSVVSLVEGEMTEPSIGLKEEYLGMGVCIVLMVPVVLYATLIIANLLAQAGWVRSGKCSVWVGYLVVPVGLTVVLLYVGTLIQQEACDNAWATDVERSAKLYTTVFSTLYGMMPTLTGATLSETLRACEQMTEGRAYQVAVAVGDERHLAQTLFSPEVQEKMFARADDEPTSFSGVTDDGYLYNAKPITSLASLLVVLRAVGAKAVLWDEQYLPALLLGVGATLVLGSVVLLLLLPFESLGKLDTPSHMTGPWEGRQAEHWPYTMVLKGFVVMAVTIVVFSCAIARLSMHFQRMEVLRSFYLDRNDKVRRLESSSDLIAQSYTSMLAGIGFAPQLVESSGVRLSELDQLRVGSFYQRLVSLVKRDKYFMYSTVDALRKSDPDTWPVLSNMTDLQYFNDNLAETPEGKQFQLYVSKYETEFYRAALMSNATFFQEGDAALQAQLVDALKALNTKEYTEDMLHEAFAMAVAQSESYFTIAQGYKNKIWSVKSFDDLFSSDDGVDSSAYEDNISAMSRGLVLPCRAIDLSYPWDQFNSIYVLIAFAALALVYLVLDVTYTGVFFAQVPIRVLLSASKGTTGQRVTLPTNDYTTPREVMQVNSQAVARAAHRLYLCVATLTLLTIVAGVVVQQRATANMNELRDSASYFQDGLVKPSDSLKDSATIEMNLALWARAFLSLNNDHINTAIVMNKQWSAVRVVTWVGGKAGHDSSKLSSSLTRTLLSATKNITSAIMLRREENSVEGVYKDFVWMLGQYEAEFHFPDYETCLHSLIYMYEEYSQEIMLCLVQNAPTSCYTEKIAPLIAFSSPCAAQRDPHFDLYVLRLAALRQRADPYFMDHRRLSNIMNSVIPDTRDQVKEVMDYITGTFDKMKTQDSMIVPWIAMLYAWMASPLLIVLYVYAAKMHSSIYYQ